MLLCLPPACGSVVSMIACRRQMVDQIAVHRRILRSARDRAAASAEEHEP